LPQKVVLELHRHAPETHSSRSPQARPQVPQLFMSCRRSAHPPLQAVRPPGHAQMPFAQVEPDGQALPHTPQLPPEDRRSTQALPHAVVPAGQPQLPPLQI